MGPRITPSSPTRQWSWRWNKVIDKDRILYFKDVCKPPCMCFPHVSIVCMNAHPSISSVPIPAETSALRVPPHTRRMPSRSIRLQQPPPHPHPWPPRQRKEQESIEMNGQPSASWRELNGNVKLTTDAFCLSVEGPVSLGSPNRIIPSQWQSTPHCFHFMSLLSV